jgi:hypothetical protein
MAAVAALAGNPISPSPTLRLPAAAAAASGEYVDRIGSRHAWVINHAHTLIWEGKPYLPAGVLLHVPATSNASQEEAEGGPVLTGSSPPGNTGSRLTSTVSSVLDLLKAHGIQDVCLVRSGGWLAGTAATDQTLVDSLEERGIRFGIALDARPERPLVGYVASPTRIEVPAEWRQPGRHLKWTVPLPGARSALYALVDVDSDTVVAAGRVPVREDQAHVEIALRPARRIFAPGVGRLLVIPERELSGLPDEEPIDFWSGWEDVRDRLAARLGAVKWGPGLRFFARPAPASLELRGATEDLVPSSGGFRVQFESWLERRYSVADLNAAWGLNDRQIGSLSAAARLVPLWSRGEHGEKTGWLIDPVTDEWFRTDLHRCGFWRDFEQFRTESIRGALNAMATLLKRTVADVPVVEEWGEYHPLFTDPQSLHGMDGLAFVSEGWGREAATGSAAFAYAQAEGAPGSTWFIQLGQSAGTSSPPGSSEELRLDWNWLAELGCKGFFADGVCAADAAAEAPGGNPVSSVRPALDHPGPSWDLAAAAERLDWVRDFSERVARDGTIASYRPAVLYYPSDAVGLGLTGRLDCGVWWLPSFSPGRELTLGDEIEGYWIERSPDPAPVDAARGVVVLWSTGAPRKATFVAPPEGTVNVYDALGHLRQSFTKHSRLQLALDANPVIITGLPLQDLFPVETTEQALQEYETLLKAAEAQKLDVASLKLTLSEAKTLFRPSTAATTYALIRPPLEALRGALTPYLWIEGEAANHHNWNGVQPDPHASAGASLHLDRNSAPVDGPYQARYSFHIRREAPYEVWMAGSVPGGRDISNFTWRIDDRAPSLVIADGTSRHYTPSLGWTRLGQVPLSVGLHTLTITAAGPASTGSYHLDLDALVLSREPFQPNGIRRPHLGAVQAMGPSTDAPH